MLVSHLVRAVQTAVYLVLFPHHAGLTCLEFAAFVTATDSRWHLKTAVGWPFYAFLPKTNITAIALIQS